MSKRRNARKSRADNQASVTAMDAFSNPAARTGFGTMDLLQATEYPMTRMTQNYQLLTSLYRENWIIQNIIATIPTLCGSGTQSSRRLDLTTLTV